MKKLFIHNAFFRLLAPLFYGALIYILILLINNNLDQLGNTFMNQEVYVCIGLVYVLSEVLRRNAMLCSKFIKDKVKNQIIVQVLIGIALAMGLTTFIISAFFRIVYEFSIAESQLIIFNLIYGVSSLLYNLMYFSNVYIEKQNVRLLETEQHRKKALEAEFSQFKNEVNPDLLYESLETLITLIYKDFEEGEDYIDHLSAVYRYILSHRKVELSRLEMEIKAAENIIYLLNYRFDNRIKFVNKLPKEYGSTPVVPATLPNLVEMIARTTIINTYQPLTIELVSERENGYLILQHKLNEKLIGHDSADHNFQSIQKTYSFYSDKPVVRVKAYDFSYIKIPLLEQVDEPLELQS